MLAHSGHWATNLVYLVPIVGVAALLFWQSRRDRPRRPVEDQGRLPPRDRARPRAVRRLDRPRRRRAVRGLPIKVAVLAEADDINEYAELFGQPERHANALAESLSSGHSGEQAPLLVVSPTGIAGDALGDDGDAVSHLANANGHDAR